MSYPNLGNYQLKKINNKMIDKDENEQKETDNDQEQD